jgi:hypothetical protein
VKSTIANIRLSMDPIEYNRGEREYSRQMGNENNVQNGQNKTIPGSIICLKGTISAH